MPRRTWPPVTSRSRSLDASSQAMFSALVMTQLPRDLPGRRAGIEKDRVARLDQRDREAGDGRFFRLILIFLFGERRLNRGHAGADRSPVRPLQETGPLQIR